MDLNSIIVSQIEKVDREKKAEAEAVRQREEAEAAAKAKAEAEKRAIRLIEDEKEFVSAKNFFEASCVREVMNVIADGLNYPKKNKEYLLLREKSIKGSAPCITKRPKFSLQKPRSFTQISSYYISFRYDDTDEILTFRTNDGRIWIERRIYIDSCHHKSMEEILSLDKEKMAIQIINLLMTE